jgi:hypothetical protein
VPSAGDGAGGAGGALLSPARYALEAFLFCQAQARRLRFTVDPISRAKV